jgi:hypothetical protein
MTNNDGRTTGRKARHEQRMTDHVEVWHEGNYQEYIEDDDA